MHVRSTLISMAAVVAIATAVPANGDGKPFPPGSGGRCQDGCAIPRGAQAVGTQPFPPGSGGDYHDGPLLNVHGPTVPIQHGRGPIPRGAQGPDPQRFSPVSGEGHWDGRGPYTVARNFEGSKPYFSVHGPTVIPIHTKNGVIPGKMTPRDLEGKELDATEFDGPCKASSDCNVGSLCIANWCTVARELDDGTLVLPPRNIVGEDVSISPSTQHNLSPLSSLQNKRPTLPPLPTRASTGTTSPAPPWTSSTNSPAKSTRSILVTHAPRSATERMERRGAVLGTSASPLAASVTPMTSRTTTKHECDSKLRACNKASFFHKLDFTGSIFFHHLFILFYFIFFLST
ncbi:hypothetical protein BDW66DRAFT_95844 [Aspergillus desertorum]